MQNMTIDLFIPSCPTTIKAGKAIQEKETISSGGNKKWSKN
jgi:hypothetical protein